MSRRRRRRRRRWWWWWWRWWCWRREALFSSGNTRGACNCKNQGVE